MLPKDDTVEVQTSKPKIKEEEDKEALVAATSSTGDKTESKDNVVGSSSLSEEGLLKTEDEEEEDDDEVHTKKSESDDDKTPTTTTTSVTMITTTVDEEEKKSDEEPLAKRVRCESSDEELSKEFTDIVLASEGFENRQHPPTSSSVRVKPVVLAPRTNGNYHHQTVTSSASVVVSVKPRIQPQKRRYPPPSGRLPSGSALVEEWFKKMKPPLFKEEDDDDSHPLHESPAAMNLSLKSKPVYLRPHKGPTSLVTVSCNPPSHPPPYPKPPLSPPRLEIKKISSSSDKSSSSKNRYYPHPPNKKSSHLHVYNKPSPQTDLVYSDMMDAIKDRAVRDLHLAHTKDMHGNFPIHMSVLMRKPSLVRRYCCVLHILNSNVDLTNEDKYTALHLAVLDNSAEIVELLLSFGADPSIKDHRGNTCFHQAVAMKSNDCLKLLVEHLRTKEDLDSFNDSGMTALQIAIKKNAPSCVHTLIQSGANLNIPENYKNNSHLSPKNEHNKIISERYLSLSRLH
ncbi:uncharacterized protein [Lepeophtheirus salmonis]|uniref:uncharacterized protein isoform X2 n=1 Tax=Lepeophtheirus salmonis TaxID=72036 RepID=UPI001AE74706|nr:B-cell lymphoma 3 protein-like isoform X2 [Lepeophtheirus salmonis]